MGQSDLLTRAAAALVLLVGGLAVADSVRGCERSDREASPPPAEAPTTSVGLGPEPRPDAPAGWPEGALDGILTFVDADTCRLRTIGLAAGRERPLSPYETSCEGFWAPRISARLAYGYGADTFRISDLGHGERAYGDYQLPANDDIIWSFDGQRLAWCNSQFSGIEREVLGGEGLVAFCPIAYTPEGELAAVYGRRLVLGTETLVRATGRIDYAQFGLDGSVVVVVDAERLERYAGGEPDETALLPDGWTGARPVASPDGCLVAVPTEDRISVIALCPGQTSYGFPGHAAAWSPDGDWLAVADLDGIFFYGLGGDGQTLVWPASAVRLAWRPG